jgi:hypothetical protein
MTFEQDPNRINRPRSSYDTASSGWGLIVIALVVAGALAFIFLLLPASDTTTQRVTENAPKIEKPATVPTPTPAPPPAKSPAPTTPPGGTPVPTTPPAQ